MRLHLDHLAFSYADEFDDFSGASVRHVDREQFDRFLNLPVDHFRDDVRLGDREFISFPAHVFNQDRDMKNAAPADVEGVGSVVFDSQGDVALGFFEKTLPDVPAADVFALLAEER